MLRLIIVVCVGKTNLFWEAKLAIQLLCGIQSYKKTSKKLDG
jgi:hypothetical protein